VLFRSSVRVQPPGLTDRLCTNSLRVSQTVCASTASGSHRLSVHEQPPGLTDCLCTNSLRVSQTVCASTASGSHRPSVHEQPPGLRDCLFTHRTESQFLSSLRNLRFSQRSCPLRRNAVQSAKSEKTFRRNLSPQTWAEQGIALLFVLYSLCVMCPRLFV
jgi:hypothetical protein